MIFYPLTYISPTRDERIGLLSAEILESQLDFFFEG